MTKLDFSQSNDETLAEGLPEGWVRSRLGAVIWPSKNRIEPSQQPNAPYLGLEHIESHSTKVLGHGRASDVKSTKAVFGAGDVLYGKLRPYLNKVCVPDFAGVCSTDFLVFDQKPWLDSRFLLWSLLRREVVEYANHHSTGVELPRISYDALASLDFWLPPLNEQNRIVARIEQLMTHTNVLRERLSRVPAILKRFREAVLAAACSGRLTEDWRQRHFFPTDAVDRQLAALRRARRDVLNKKPLEGPVEPNPDFISDVPEPWRTVSLDVLSVRITSGSRDWKRYYRENGRGTFIMAQNVRPLFFDRSFRLAVAPPLHDRDRERSQVNEGDILVTIVGANTGDVCRVLQPVEEHYVCQSVALIRPVNAQLSPFLELYLNSPAHGQAQYKDWIYGEGRPHLSFDQLRQTAVVLPPIEEQQEIVKRVNTLFGLADIIANRVSAASRRADKLTQSILAKAFRGELVPTEAELARREGREYEPASALLERIKKERTNGPKPAKRGRKSVLTAASE